MGKVRLKEIYGLFSIANNYDQPDNNLVILWDELPSFHEIADVIDICESDYDSLMRGEEIEDDVTHTSYRLQLVTFGKPLPEYETKNIGGHLK